MSGIVPGMPLRPFLLVLAGALSAFADIGPKPSSEAPGLEATGDMKGIDVEMAAEEVALTLGRADRDAWVDRLRVEATFEMKNTGGDAAFEEGFPIGPVKNMKGFEIEIDGAKVAPKLVDRFEGKVVPVTEAEADKYDETGRHDYWYVWEAKYPAGATRVHKVRYALELFGFSEYRHASYLLSTGSRWKGPIGKAVVTFRTEAPLTLEHVRSARPLRNGTRRDGAIRWEFENIEPTTEDDVDIQYHMKSTWEEDLSRLREDAKKHWSAKKQVAWTLGHAHERFPREARNAAERADYVDAIRAILDEAVEKEGRWEFPAEERQRAQIGEDVPPEIRAEIERSLQNEPREYAMPGQAAQLFEFFEPLLAAAGEEPKSAAVRAALERWVAAGEAFLAGEVTAGGNALVFPGETATDELKRLLAEARELLK
ncbi:MAG: hypothetical protein FD180_1237 [Planctomycetota bacterium]|nr:MAG: hypothetical protein FD180_1237 [Planctomycetota bacterium]